MFTWKMTHSFRELCIMFTWMRTMYYVYLEDDSWLVHSFRELCIMFTWKMTWKMTDMAGSFIQRTMYYVYLEDDSHGWFIHLENYVLCLLGR